MRPDKPRFQFIPTYQLNRGKYQPRKQFAETDLVELADSIRSNGLVQPIIVRPLGDEFEIVAGERRWRAALLVGLETVPCLIRDYTDEQVAAVTTVENTQRLDLNPIEEANAYLCLLEQFDYSHEELSALMGKSRTKITNNLRLLKLNSSIQECLIDGRLSEGHGKVLAGLSMSEQTRLAQATIKNEWSVRRLEQEAKKRQKLSTVSAQDDPNITSLEQALSYFLGSQVTLEVQNEQGRMIINFDNLDVLDGLLKRIGFESDLL
jgi:ParB family transcriptional regulator, chromosome partitioning protein